MVRLAEYTLSGTLTVVGGTSASGVTVCLGPYSPPYRLRRLLLYIRNPIWYEGGDNRLHTRIHATSTVSVDGLVGNMAGKDMTLKANSYTVSFVADGHVVSRETFFTGEDSVNVPEAIHIDGYTGSWEEFALGIGDVTVNAVYVKDPVPTDDRTGEFSPSSVVITALCILAVSSVAVLAIRKRMA